MSESEDEWGHYFADMCGRPASIVFNDSISQRIYELPLPRAMELRIELKESNEDGLTTQAESERLFAIEDEIEKAILRVGGEPLGRVTNKGVRWVFALVPEDYSSIERAAIEAMQRAGYEGNLDFPLDPERRVYWEDLYPTDDDRRVMNDMRVLGSLLDHGDIKDVSRRVDHWSFFEDKRAAKAFSSAIKQNGFIDINVGRSDGRWCVTCVHEGTTHLNDITHWTLKISRLAREHGGEYDGWGTHAESAPPSE